MEVINIIRRWRFILFVGLVVGSSAPVSQAQMRDPPPSRFPDIDPSLDQNTDAAIPVLCVCVGDMPHLMLEKGNQLIDQWRPRGDAKGWLYVRPTAGPACAFACGRSKQRCASGVAKVGGFNPNPAGVSGSAPNFYGLPDLGGLLQLTIGSVARKDC
jgi:hypothetical protein